MTRHLRVRGKYRKPLGEDQIALAFLMLARQLREEAQKDAEAKRSQIAPKRRAA